MISSGVQKIRAAIALLRTHGENDAADGLLEVVEPKVLGVVKFAVSSGYACRHAYVTSGNGVASAGSKVVCNACGIVLGTFLPATDGQALFISSEPEEEAGPRCGDWNEDPSTPGLCYCGRPKEHTCHKG
ncbi:MAG: hypothetical protein Q8P41_31665 [Pseudomonadota bacterium]|nr:hypothetical protein [Pseudomonadota bacterium]